MDPWTADKCCDCELHQLERAALRASNSEFTILAWFVVAAHSQLLMMIWAFPQQ